VSGQAIEWAGGVGFTRETGIEKFWRDSKIVSTRLLEELLRSLIDLLPTCSGRYLRRDVQHSTTDNRQVHSEGILIESRS
jgi:hypothetical protein